MTKHIQEKKICKVSSHVMEWIVSLKCICISNIVFFFYLSNIRLVCFFNLMYNYSGAFFMIFNYVDTFFLNIFIFVNRLRFINRLIIFVSFYFISYFKYKKTLNSKMSALNSSQK